MTPQDFKDLTGFEPAYFNAINWAYRSCVGGEEAFAKLINSITGGNAKSFRLLAELIDLLKDKYDSLADAKDDQECRADRLAQLAYTWSQADEEHIDEVAELYGKDAYCARVVKEGGKLTDELKDYVAEKVLLK